MKKLSKLIKFSFAFLALTVFLIQSCTETDTNLSPKGVADDVSKPSIDWATAVDVPDACKSVCLVAGQHMNVGSVDVALSGGYLYVSYNILEPGIYIEEAHLEIFASEQELLDAKKLNGGGATPGKFDYHKTWSAEDMITTHSVMIPESDLPGYCFYIASHAALSNGETAWGGVCNESDNGVTLVNALQFPGNNWSVYFQFCADECDTSPIDFTYAWEDLRNSGNDADYNDLVVQSDVMKSSGELTIDFFASARGAAYDHAFKIKLPMQGVVSIAGDQGVVDDGTHYYITVFPSTKAALPEFVNGFSANTYASDVTCDPTATAQLVIEIDGSYVFDETKPFEPFITVWPSGTAGDGANYDLYVYEVSGIDTWSDGENTYPNGILIPDDWQWPIERMRISNPYPDFVSIEGGYPLANWAANLVNPGQVWSCE